MALVVDWALAHQREIAANLSAPVNLTSPSSQLINRHSRAHCGRLGLQTLCCFGDPW